MNKMPDPKPAASVIVLRPAHPRGFEVLLTRRPAAMAFLGGMYCFPGGSLRDEDCSDLMLARSRGLTPEDARAIVGAHFAPRKALGFWCAAIRELFEETGILLAIGPGGQCPALDNAQLAVIHAEWATKTARFSELLKSKDLFCDTSRLAYFSHWRTPADVASRFDTRFFLAELPENQTPLVESDEVAHSLWTTPDHALRLFEKSELPMIFPTFASLRALADFDSHDAVAKEFHVAGKR